VTRPLVVVMTPSTPSSVRQAPSVEGLTGHHGRHLCSAMAPWITVRGGESTPAVQLQIVYANMSISSHGAAAAANSSSKPHSGSAVTQQKILLAIGYARMPIAYSKDMSDLLVTHESSLRSKRLCHFALGVSILPWGRPRANS